MKEMWKDLGNGYKVSTFGRFKNKKNIEIRGFTNKGYCQVYLAGRRVMAHRVVAEAFIPNPNGLPVVNHLDGNRKNNRVDNLEWATYSDNTTHAVYCLKNNMPSKKVIRLDDGKEYPTITLAAKENGFDRNRFQARIRYNSYYGGHHWRIVG